VSIVTIEPQQLVEQDRLLLLERAQQHRALTVARRLAQRVRQAERRVELGRDLRYVGVT
jgi:predicted transposase YdaD